MKVQCVSVSFFHLCLCFILGLEGSQLKRTLLCVVHVQHGRKLTPGVAAPGAESLPPSFPKKLPG